MKEIRYQFESALTSAEFIDVLRRSTLAERRPVEDAARIESMLRHADLIATARCDGLLVGVGRAVTDFSFCCYVSDLAVDEAFQRQGIGRTLLAKLREATGPQVKHILIAAPKAVSYYPHIGMIQHHSCWTTE
jgi:ribosomal protein S18 acetylase RimI-like enzyme